MENVYSTTIEQQLNLGRDIETAQYIAQDQLYAIYPQKMVDDFLNEIPWYND